MAARNTYEPFGTLYEACQTPGDRPEGHSCCAPLGASDAETSEASNFGETESEELSTSLSHSGGSHKLHKTPPNEIAGHPEQSHLLFGPTASDAQEVPEQTCPTDVVRLPSPVEVSLSSPTTTSQRITGRSVIRLRDELPPALLEECAMPPRQKSLVFSEPDATGLEEALLPITRKQTLKEVARYKRNQPVLVRLDLVRAAYANCGLTKRQIGELIGKSRYTVAKALNFAEGVDFYTVCAVMNVIGVEMAQLFALPSSEVELPERKPMKWARGPYLRENEERLLREDDLQEAMNERARRRIRK